MNATTTPAQPTINDLIALIRRADGGMASTWNIAIALDIPEAAVALLTAQARTLGLITTDRDPRTLSPMHRLTAAGRAGRTMTARPSLADRLARCPHPVSVTTAIRADQQARDAEVRAILSPAYLAWVLGAGSRPHTAR